MFDFPRWKVWLVTLTVLADAAMFIMSSFPQLTEVSPTILAERVHATGWIFIALLHLPCLAMILRRPNEGDVPSWVDQLLAWASRGRYSATRVVRSSDTHLGA